MLCEPHSWNKKRKASAKQQTDTCDDLHSHIVGNQRGWKVKSKSLIAAVALMMEG
jgi:hypothetical protein